MNEKTFRLPDNTKRTAIFGRTGTGKTQFGAFILSEAPFDQQPYVIVDYKRDQLLNAIDRAKEIGFNEVPKHPGLYILHAEPETDDDAINGWMRDVWKQEHCGILFDETYMLRTCIQAESFLRYRELSLSPVRRRRTIRATLWK